MMPFRFLLRAAVIGIAAITLSWPTQAQDITCVKGDAFRRVQVVIENARRGLPCEVVMWSTPTERRQLWRAEFEHGFCAEKLHVVVTRLTDDQWRCLQTDPPPTKRQPAGLQPVM